MTKEFKITIMIMLLFIIVLLIGINQENKVIRQQIIDYYEVQNENNLLRFENNHMRQIIREEHHNE